MLQLSIEEALAVNAEAQNLKNRFPFRRIFVMRLAEGGDPYVTAVTSMRIPKRMLRSGEAVEVSEITFG